MSNEKQGSEPTVFIRDLGDLRRYRTEIPNIIDDMNLSVYAFRLYVHLKRVAGANGGECWQGVRTMSKKCNMSASTIKQAKEELVARGLIHVERRDPTKGESDVISILDIWAQNFAAFTTQTNDEQPDRTAITPDRVAITPDRTAIIRSNPIKNKPMKKEPEGDQSAAPTPPAPPPSEETVTDPPENARSETKPKTKAKTKSEPNPNTQPIMDAYVEALAYEKPLTRSQYSKEINYAKELAEAGYTPEEVAATYHLMKADVFWEKKHLSLYSIQNQIAALIQQAKARASGNGKARYNVNGLGGTDQGNGNYSTVSKTEQEEWLAKQRKRPF